MKKHYIGYTLAALFTIVVSVAAGWYLFEIYPGGEMQVSTTTESMSMYQSGPYQIGIRLNPETPAVGKNWLSLNLNDQQGNPVSGADIQAYGEMAAMSTMQAMRAPAELEETVPGMYEGPFELQMSGTWPLTVNISKQGMGDVRLNFDMATGRSGLQITSGGTAINSMQDNARSTMPDRTAAQQDANEIITTGTITVDNHRRQLIGLKTGEAKSRHLVSDIRAVGQVMYDETRLSDVSLRFDAWVGDLKADFVGKEVRRGDMLFSVYSPELLAAQLEYLELLKRRRGRTDSFIKAAQKRLLLWDMTSGQIKQLAERGEPLDYVPIMAPRSGTVVEKKVVTGTALKAGITLIRIADLSRVWIEADVYESELNLIKPGMDAVITLPYTPNQTYRATVDYIYPYLMGNTRTGRIRLTIDNKDGTLKPNMYAEVRLKTDLGERLSVPEEAVLFAGNSRVVFVDLGEGKLKPKKIKTGVRTRDYIEVLEGLNPGEKVVTSGNFLIAAESRLKSVMKQW